MLDLGPVSRPISQNFFSHIFVHDNDHLNPPSLQRAKGSQVSESWHSRMFHLNT